MNAFFSIVMICKNAASTIGASLRSIQGLSNDVVVYDSGSTDGTQAIVQQWGVRLVEGPWLGFGPTRQHASGLAQKPWVLMLDADEEVAPALYQVLQSLQQPQSPVVFRIRLQHFVAGQPLHWGPWRADYRMRLYPKTIAWNGKLVHEKLALPPQTGLQKLAAPLYHHTASDLAAFALKMKGYAVLTAVQYQAEGRKARWWKPYLSPLAFFVQQYLLRLGFLDGRRGWQLTLVFCRYTFEKYRLLQRGG